MNAIKALQMGKQCIFSTPTFPGVTTGANTFSEMKADLLELPLAIPLLFPNFSFTVLIWFNKNRYIMKLKKSS